MEMNVRDTFDTVMPSYCKGDVTATLEKNYIQKHYETWATRIETKTKHGDTAGSLGGGSTHRVTARMHSRPHTQRRLLVIHLRVLSIVDGRRERRADGDARNKHQRRRHQDQLCHRRQVKEPRAAKVGQREESLKQQNAPTHSLKVDERKGGRTKQNQSEKMQETSPDDFAGFAQVPDVKE